jgi:tellurite resistance protein TerC
MEGQALAWVLFNVLVLGVLVLDLAVFHRRPHVLGVKEAVGWVIFWVALAAVFAVFVYSWKGRAAALEFATGYLIEESLSMDNMFVFLMIFSYFAVPRPYQHRVLFWGILGALFMRAALIFAGVTMIQRFHWVIYLFGGFLIITGIKMVFLKDKEFRPEANPILRLVRRCIPLASHYEGSNFFTKENGRLAATPLFIVLVVIETTDLIFALDSIPAVLAITHDPFIVYTSNVFAILGLRALFFAVAGALELAHYLHYGLSAILVFVGVKMLLSDYYRMPLGVALGTVAGILAISLVASWVRHRRRTQVSRLEPMLATSESALPSDGSNG